MSVDQLTRSRRSLTGWGIFSDVRLKLERSRGDDLALERLSPDRKQRAFIGSSFYKHRMLSVRLSKGD